MGCAAYRGSRSAQRESLFCPSPKGESFVDRPTSNSPRPKKRTILGKSSSRERRRKKCLGSRQLRNSARDVTNRPFRKIRETIYKGVPDSSRLLVERKKGEEDKRMVIFLKNTESIFRENLSERRTTGGCKCLFALC